MKYLKEYNPNGVDDVLKKINDNVDMNYLNNYSIFEKNSKFINLKNFNLEKSYSKLNKSLFSGKLPNVELRWTQSKKELGVVKWDEKSKKIDHLGISTHYQYVESELLSVLAHEMIHIWQIQNGKTDGHGKEFEKKMIEINKKSKFGIHVLPKQPMEHMKMTNPDLTKDYGFVIIRKGKTDYEIATYDPKKTDYKNLLTIVKQNLKKGQKIEIEVRLTQNGLVQKYKKDSSNKTIHTYKLDELSYNTLVNDSKKIYSN